MSIEIEIIPLTSQRFTWRDLRQQVARDLPAYPGLRDIWVEPEMIRGSARAPLPADLPLEPRLGVGFELPRPCTISLFFAANTSLGTGKPDDEFEYLASCAPNMTEGWIRASAEAWKEAGYSMTLETYGGRALYERQLLVLLAVSVAKVTRGLILPKDDAFTIPIGCYSPEEFAGASIRKDV